MTGRRVHDLTPSVLAQLPAPCRSCVFWEVADAPRGSAPDGAAAKEAWWQATQLEWGTPGKACFDGDRLVGYATFGPGDHFGRSRRLGPPPSEDAILLAALWVAEAERGTGVASQLLQSALREVHRRGVRALEAYAARDALSASPCMLPEAALAQLGFAVHRDHGAHPLMRLDLRQTARWSESVSHALEGVVSALSRRERAPAPAPARSSVHGSSGR